MITEYLKAQILKVMQTALDKSANKQALLVTDDRTTKIMDSCLKVHQLNDMGIGVLVNIKYNRERVNVTPIYFLTPDLASIERFCKDYADPKALQYGPSVHLFLCGSISQAGLKMIKKSRVRSYLKTFQEIYCDFVALEDQVFYFNRPEAFSNLYLTKDKETVKSELSDQAIKLFSTIVSMEEDPYIRYAKESGRAAAVASVFQDYLKQMKANMKGFKPREKRATLIILDRSQDPVAPLTHEVTYQCMIKDFLGTDAKFLEVKDDSADGGSKKFYYRDDPLWQELRHANMGNVVPDLKRRFEHFKKTNAVAKRDAAGDNEQKVSLVQTVRDLPMYKKMAKSFTSHFAITKQLSKKFTQLNLGKVGDMEQSLITMIDPNGKPAKIKDLQKELTFLLKDPTVSTEIKLRLLCIYIISQGGIADKQKNMLFLAANISQADQESIYNLARLGVAIKSDSGSKPPRPPHYADLQAEAKKLANSEIVQTRFEPLVSLVLRKLIANKLSTKDYPFIGDEPDAGVDVTSSFGGRSHRKKNRGATDQARIIVFMIGGGSFNEVRQCYELSKKGRPVFMGSSHFMSPAQYLEQLKAKPPTNAPAAESKTEE